MFEVGLLEGVSHAQVENHVLDIEEVRLRYKIVNKTIHTIGSSEISR